MTWKSYVIASGAGLLATYLVSTPPPSAPARVPAAVERAAAPQATSTVDIQAEASRLQARVREEIAYREPSRNPFRYGGRDRAPRAPVGEPDVVPAPPEPVPPPVPEPTPITLAGIAAKVVEGVRQRTAILLTPNGPMEVREGDAVGDYRVVRIEEDAVELAVADGTRRRLSLRP